MFCDEENNLFILPVIKINRIVNSSKRETVSLKRLNLNMGNNIMSEDKMIVVPSNKIEEGKRYFVKVHGTDGKWLKAFKVPHVPMKRMKKRDAFVFACRAGAPELVFKPHGTGGPQFLITKIKNKHVLIWRMFMIENPYLHCDMNIICHFTSD